MHLHMYRNEVSMAMIYARCIRRQWPLFIKNEILTFDFLVTRDSNYIATYSKEHDGLPGFKTQHSMLSCTRKTKLHFRVLDH